MDAYKTMPDAFPAYLKGCKRVVAVLGQGGVVVSHWPAEMDAFEFHQSDKAIGEIANEQSDGAFSGTSNPVLKSE